MRSEELISAGELAGAAAAGLASHIHELHEAIAQRVWDGVGPMAAPVRVAHDRVSDAVYNGVGGSLRRAGRAGARALAAGQAAQSPSLTRTPAGRIALGVLNGAFGDALERDGSALALGMTLHPSTVPNPTGRIAVFVHGLCETEDAWQLGHERHTPYGPRLQAELGYTPIYVRYNTGRRISENGRSLASLLTSMVESWPVEVHEIVLIGHSMGGLVIRCACGEGGCDAWAPKVRRVFSLGSPHGGAPLERAASAAGAGLALIPETRGLATALGGRSAGIKDLGFANEVPFLEGADHYFIGASLRGPLGRVVGDLLVLRASAWASGGRGQRTQFPVDRYSHFEGLNHFSLLNHPAVYDVIRGVLAGRPGLPPDAGPGVTEVPVG